MTDKCTAQTTLATVLAHLIDEKPEGRVIHNLLACFPTLQELLDATEEELTAISGIGPVKAYKLISSLDLARTICSITSRPSVVRSARDVFNHLKVEMQYLPKEYFVVIGLDNKRRILFSEVVAIGSLDAAIIHPREAFRPVLKRNAEAVIFVHNHPSGDSFPSREDIEITKRLQQSGEILGIRVVDHIIIGFERYFSLAEQGYL
ncbi:DNA repair protein radc [Brevibacillus sp. CF112]|uniref:RadC family protein n=1 Tax=Brevibacillus TaxID=55080 RepID=UPI0002719053|nr:DNA repair protein RadC [Brevibacillus sp. CF112]EJL46191.1 DNA repair protein radc [Brevibacillus sp. CF112]